MTFPTDYKISRVPKDPMKQVKAYLDEKSSVEGVHILVGLLMETYWHYFANWNAKDKSISYWGSVDDPWEMTSYFKTAQYVAAVSIDPSAKGVFKYIPALWFFPF